eukprot:TRINITY_DN2915_c0_g1_i1.p1 TRINITY_DN2915_c0_g1~~TRINITY_DN2915_c0_g1_i1.p1  ORF type:complete len:561 (-),score=106.12 TRINITY_DN2915_c0_g1_i1:15-1697(-)
MKEGRFANVIAREDVIMLAALQFQLMVGDHNPALHTIGFMTEKEKVKYIHTAFRKDTSIEADIYLEHAKLKGKGENEIKRHYVTITRVLKRLAENLLPIQIYSADKIEAKEAVLVVGENLIIFDAKDQATLFDIPVNDIHRITDQHTSTHEREKLRKQLGHVSHLHQVIIDYGKNSILRVMSGDRDAVKRRYEGIIELMDTLKKEKEIEEAEQLKLRSQQLQQQQPQQTPKTIVQEPSLLIAGQYWLFSIEKCEIQEIKIKVFLNTHLFQIFNANTNILILEVNIDSFQCWRQEQLSYDNRTQLATTLKGQAYQVHQLFIDRGDSHSIRILSLERWKIRNILKLVSDQISPTAKEQFFCQMSISNQNLKNAFMKVSDGQIDFLDCISATTLLEVPVNCISSWEVQPIPTGLKSKFEQDINDSIVLQLNTGSSLLLGTNEVSHMAIEIKKLIFNAQSHHLVKDDTEIPVRGWLLHEKHEYIPNVSLQCHGNKMVVTSSEEKVFTEVPLTNVESWTLYMVTKTDHQECTLLSTEPQINDVKNIQNLLTSISNHSALILPTLT